MNKTFVSHVIADSIISPLGWTTSNNFDALMEGISGIRPCPGTAKYPLEHVSSVINSELIDDYFTKFGDVGLYTKFEKICIASIQDALSRTDINPSSERLGVIISTTKGNIDILLDAKNDRIPADHKYLFSAAKFISSYFQFRNNPIVISNACISGVLALITAHRLILSDVYDHVVVCGADLVTPFTLSGFNALKALSHELCRPFDRDRSGINLGEAAATVVLSHARSEVSGIRVCAGSVSNDANHISGPSRTGEGMQSVISGVLSNYNRDIDFISAHGTATIYNDEMEATALSALNLNHIPVHSLKGYYGHTLGAAGLVESIVGYQSILNQSIIKSLGFNNPGTTHRLNINRNTVDYSLSTCLKTSSGFGGCNAAILFDNNK